MAENRTRGMPVTIEFIRGRCEIDPVTECWKWAREVDPYGYGQIWYNGRLRPVSRVVLELHSGEAPPPREKYALHKCDNPTCCNPEHLFWGTAKENTHDSIKKGRFRMGVTCGFARFTAAEIIDIRSRKDRVTDIANEYKVHTSMISNIRSRRTYRSVPESVC